MTTTRFVLLLILVVGVVTAVSSRFIQNLEDDIATVEQGNTAELALRLDAGSSAAQALPGESFNSFASSGNSDSHNAESGVIPDSAEAVGENMGAHERDTRNSYVDNLRGSCDENCAILRVLLEPSYVITDSELEHALGLSDVLASTLADNPELQRALIERALHSSGNTRTLIISAFNQLGLAIQKDLGRALVESEQKAQRLDGVQLLSSAGVLNEEVVPLFEQLYSSETDITVREAIVKGLDSPDVFRGNAAVVDFLTRIVHYDTESSVRGGALLASVRLSDDANFAISQSLEAIRSDTANYQNSGARALSNFVDIHTNDGKGISSQHYYEIEQLMSDIMSEEFHDLPAQARTELDKLYSRFF